MQRAYVVTIESIQAHLMVSVTIINVALKLSIFNSAARHITMLDFLQLIPNLEKFTFYAMMSSKI